MCDTHSGTCICNYYWTGQTCDDDVNECTNKLICENVPNTGCHNKQYGYDCACLRGFMKDNADNCIQGLYDLNIVVEL